jgi:hypothetical protein
MELKGDQMKRLALFMGVLMLTSTNVLAKYDDDEGYSSYFVCKIYCSPYNEPENWEVLASGRQGAASLTNYAAATKCLKPGKMTMPWDCSKKQVKE